jgi:hypothetical protein
MRWIKREGDIVTDFLWFPKTIENETRWLEVASWQLGRKRSGIDQWTFYPARWADDELVKLYEDYKKGIMTWETYRQGIITIDDYQKHQINQKNETNKTS